MVYRSSGVSTYWAILAPAKIITCLAKWLLLHGYWHHLKALHIWCTDWRLANYKLMSTNIQMSYLWKQSLIAEDIEYVLSGYRYRMKILYTFIVAWLTLFTSEIPNAKNCNNPQPIQEKHPHCTFMCAEQTSFHGFPILKIQWSRHAISFSCMELYCVIMHTHAQMCQEKSLLPKLRK